MVAAIGLGLGVQHVIAAVSVCIKASTCWRSSSITLPGILNKERNDLIPKGSGIKYEINPKIIFSGFIGADASKAE